MFYNLKQGLKNICRNFRLSLASVATISACIFLFCLFFSIIVNLTNIVKNIETKVGITVFFEENLSRAEIEKTGEEIAARPEVREMTFTSAEDAWDSFKKDYFEGREELAEGFAEDNPLKGSANYTIFLKEIENQDAFVAYLKGLDGVREVNYSSHAGESLATFNRILQIVSFAIVVILLGVGIFLISNTVAVSAEFRKNETAIMRLIGATNHMIRMPFLIEGIVLGLIGAAIPLAVIYWLYGYAIDYLHTHFALLSEAMEFVPIETIFPQMLAVALVLGVGIGFIASQISIRKHLRV